MRRPIDAGRPGGAVGVLATLVLTGILLVLGAAALARPAAAQPAIAFAMGTAPITDICHYNVVTYKRTALMTAAGEFDPRLLDVARACGTRVIVILHGVSADISADAGGLDLAKFEDRIDDFAGLIDPYVADGTVVGHLTVDEPHDCQDWNDVCPEPETVDAAAAVSRAYWPTLETGINTLPGYASLIDWVETDRVYFTYAYHKGDLNTFVDDAVAVVTNGHFGGLSWAVQALSGGCATFGDCSMTPEQVTEVGELMCATETGGVLLFNEFDTALLTEPMRAAVAALRDFCGDVVNPPPTPFRLTGQVYADLDNDRVLDSAEEWPLAGAVVAVTTVDGSTTVTATSGADGRFIVGGLAPVTYSVTLAESSLPVGHFNIIGGDLYFGLALTTSVDFPVRLNGVSGLVFRDLNLSGAYEAEADPVYPGVVVRLEADDGAVVVDSADSTGAYTFRGLTDSVYTISVDAATVDPDWAAWPARRTQTITLTTQFGGKDFAVQPPSGFISGTAYVDLNANQQFDPLEETALPGLAVQLVRAANGTVFTLITGGDGYYERGQLAGDTYGVGVDGATLPDGHYNVVEWDVTIAQTGQLRLDFPIRANGVSGIVYRDLDLDGVYSTTIDAPYGGVAVHLDRTGFPRRTHITSADGSYAFRGLPDATYTVTVDAATLDPDWAALPLQRSHAITTTTRFKERHFAVQPPSGTVTGTLYADRNGDRVRDPGEEPLAGVTVQLTTAAGSGPQAVYTAVSAADGLFTFSALPGATYDVTLDEAALPDGHYAVGYNPITVGQTGSATRDLGVRLNGISGMTFRDNDFDRLFTAGIDGWFAGVTLVVTGPDGITTTTTTGPDGAYDFRGVPDGTYTVAVDLGSIEPNWSVWPLSRSYALSRTTHFRTKDFALQPVLGALDGLAWWDLNANGVLDNGEAPYPSGLEVVLTYAGPDDSIGTDDDQVFAAETLIDGSIRFADLVPGLYEVDPTVEPGMTLTTDNDPFELTLAAGEESDAAQFGIFQSPTAARGAAVAAASGRAPWAALWLLGALLAATGRALRRR